MENQNASYFLSISEVSKKLDLQSHVLRFWEKQFPNFIKPTTGAGGRRYYRAADVSLISKIKDLLYNQGYTIKGVKNLLSAGGAAMLPEPAPKNDVAVDSDKINQAIKLLSAASDALNI